MTSPESRPTRRRFLKAATAGAGLGVLAQAGDAEAAGQEKSAPEESSRLPREVWVASINQVNLRTDSYQQMTRALLARMESVVPFKPDIVCIPEVAPFANLTGDRPPVEDVAEVPIGRIACVECSLKMRIEIEQD